MFPKTKLHYDILVNLLFLILWCRYNLLNQFLRSSLVRVLDSPIFGSLNGSILVFLPVVGNGLVEGVIQIGCGDQRLDGEEHCADLQSG